MEVIACYARRPRLEVVSQPGPLGVPSVSQFTKAHLSRTWRLIDRRREWQRESFTGLEPLLGAPPLSTYRMANGAPFRPSHPTSANRRSSCFWEVECVYGVEPVQWKHASVRFAETVQCSQGPRSWWLRDVIHKTDTKCLVVAERLHPTKQASFGMGLR